MVGRQRACGRPSLAASLAVAVDLALTGLLHLDGLADSADGLLPHLDRPRRLAVMAAPDVGAFAVGVVAIVLLLRVGGVAGLPTDGKAVAFTAGTWAASRTLMATAICALRPARPGGLAAAFQGARRVAAPAGRDATGRGRRRPGRGAVGAVALGAGIAVAAGVLALGRRRLGGVTGDVLGAAGVLLETVALVVAAADW